jgi:hypothetical protein
MELQTAHPPPPPLCLVRRPTSTQKGGTLIAETILDLASHQQKLSQPGGYRPCDCGNCGHSVLHVHDYRWRVLRGEPEFPGVRIVRYICTRCEAVWRVLPRFVARFLRRTWAVVEAATGCRSERSTTRGVSSRTVRRWRSRLNSRVGALAAMLSSGASATWRVAEEQTRRELAMTFDGDLGQAAAWIHELAPGARLM